MSSDLLAQSKDVKNRNTQNDITALPVLNKFLGNWIAYSRESSFAAYISFKPLANGSGVMEQFESKEGVISVGLFFDDPKTNNWCYTWVGTENEIKKSNGTRALNPVTSHSTMVYTGFSRLNNKEMMDRITFELLNENTLFKTYEVSTDNGKTWDIEFKYSFKKVK